METKIGCSIVLFNKKSNSVFIAKRSRNKIFFPGLWETIGGSLEENESLDECIIREVKEELNCSILNLRQFRTYLSHSETHKHLIVNYIGIIDGTIELNSNEIEKIAWVSESDLNNYDFFPKCKDKIIDVFAEHKYNPKYYT